MHADTEGAHRGGKDAPLARLQALVAEVAGELAAAGSGKRLIEITGRHGKIVSAKVVREDHHQLSD